jgi:hypothetical protein
MTNYKKSGKFLTDFTEAFIKEPDNYNEKFLRRSL